MSLEGPQFFISFLHDVYEAATLLLPGHLNNACHFVVSSRGTFTPYISPICVHCFKLDCSHCLFNVCDAISDVEGLKHTITSKLGSACIVLHIHENVHGLET
jgi:hypothetical protein